MLLKYVLRLGSGIILMLLCVSQIKAQTDIYDDISSSLSPLVRTVDLNVGETVLVELHDNSTAEVELMEVDAVTDAVMGAVRQVNVKIRVNSEVRTIKSGNYHLPVIAGGVQVDSPVTLDYMDKSKTDWWGLEKDARLRLWPEGSPLFWPGTLIYPVNQKWMASSKTQFSNEPVRGTSRTAESIYYHAGIDFGGVEDMVEVVAATDGILVSVGDEVLPGEPEDNPIQERYDVIYIRDARGWYYRYSHFDSIQRELKVGQRVVSGQKLGMLGKEGGSGGWSHLHFHIESKQPSGKWGVQESYAFLLQAYQRQYDPDILAVARPHKVINAGEVTTLSASNSWAKKEIQGYEWTLTDGSVKNGMEIEQTYDEPGMFSEIVKVTDIDGNYDYDFANVIVFEKDNNEYRPPRIHAAYFPTTELKAGDKIFFSVRSRIAEDGYDVWDFDDGSDPVTVKSDIDTHSHAKTGYAFVSHRYQKPGDYLVKVTRESSVGVATAHLYVKIHAR